jgi:hypothetical protein
VVLFFESIDGGTTFSLEGWQIVAGGPERSADQRIAASVSPTPGTGDRTSATRSVGMNLARRFNAGSAPPVARVASATVDNRAFQSSLARRERTVDLYPALRRRAKFIPPLRGENPCQNLLAKFLSSVGSAEAHRAPLSTRT